MRQATSEDACNCSWQNSTLWTLPYCLLKNERTSTASIDRPPSVTWEISWWVVSAWARWIARRVAANWAAALVDCSAMNCSWTSSDRTTSLPSLSTSAAHQHQHTHTHTQLTTIEARFTVTWISNSHLQHVLINQEKSEKYGDGMN